MRQSNDTLTLLYGDEYEALEGVVSTLVGVETDRDKLIAWFREVADEFYRENDGRGFLPMMIGLVSGTGLVHMLIENNSTPDKMLNHAQHLIDLSQKQDDAAVVAGIIMSEAHMVVGDTLEEVEELRRAGISEWGDQCVNLAYVYSDHDRHPLLDVSIRMIKEENGKRSLVGDWQEAAVQQRSEHNDSVLRGFAPS